MGLNCGRLRHLPINQTNYYLLKRIAYILSPNSAAALSPNSLLASFSHLFWFSCLQLYRSASLSPISVWWGLGGDKIQNILNVCLVYKQTFFTITTEKVIKCKCCVYCFFFGVLELPKQKCINAALTAEALAYFWKKKILRKI